MDVEHPEHEDHPLRQFEETKTVLPTDALLSVELDDKVGEILRDLPDNQRVALELCREEELSYDDISEVLGCSLSATKSLIHRARETLKARLKPYLASGSWKALPR